MLQQLKDLIATYEYELSLAESAHLSRATPIQYYYQGVVERYKASLRDLKNIVNAEERRQAGDPPERIAANVHRLIPRRI